MKKIIPVLAVLGSAVAFAAYKLKKEEKKKLIDLDEGLLYEDDVDYEKEKDILHRSLQEGKDEFDDFKEEVDETIEEVKEKTEDSLEDAKEKYTEVKDKVEDTFLDIKEKAKEVFDDVKEKAVTEYDQVKEQASSRIQRMRSKAENTLEDIKEKAEDALPEFAPKTEIEKLMQESAKEIGKSESSFKYSEEYPHITLDMVEEIRSMTIEAIQALTDDGDVHEQERPVQHMVSFKTKEDMENFKSRVINKGFVITKGEEEYDLIVLHISFIDEEKLMDNILYLAEQAYEFHGEYRGWQSKVSR